MTLKPNDCPACGHSMMLEDSSAAAEIYGWCLQDFTLVCSNKKCYTEFSLRGDLLCLKVGPDDFIKAWNNLTSSNE